MCFVVDPNEIKKLKNSGLPYTAWKRQHLPSGTQRDALQFNERSTSLRHFGWSLQLLVFHSQLVSKFKPPWIGNGDCSGEFSQQYRIWLWLTLPCVMEQLHCSVSDSCCAVGWSQMVRDVECRDSVEWTDTKVNTYFWNIKYSKYNGNKWINIVTYLQMSFQIFLLKTGYILWFLFTSM
jgi:hypothetical protein